MPSIEEMIAPLRVGFGSPLASYRSNGVLLPSLSVPPW